jgi:hypothetical protein
VELDLFLHVPVLQSAVAPPLLCNLAKLTNDPAPFVGAEGNEERDKARRRSP